MYSVLVNYKLFILVLVFFSWQINLFFQNFFEILFATARYGGVRSSFAGVAKKIFRALRARSSFAPPFLNSCVRPCSAPKTQASFVFFSSAKVLREFRETFAEEFCNFDGRSGLPTLCISAMILVALQNNSLIDVLCNRKYFLFVKLIFSVFIFP